jgi:hypothetical protein
MMLAWRPHSPSTTPAALDIPVGAIIALVTLVLVLGIFGFVLFFVYNLDREAWGGVGKFRRRRILQGGVPASARILSCRPLDRTTGSRYSLAYSLV